MAGKQADGAGMDVDSETAQPSPVAAAEHKEKDVGAWASTMLESPAEVRVLLGAHWCNSFSGDGVLEDDRARYSVPRSLYAVDSGFVEA